MEKPRKKRKRRKKRVQSDISVACSIEGCKRVPIGFIETRLDDRRIVKLAYCRKHFDEENTRAQKARERLAKKPDPVRQAAFAKSLREELHEHKCSCPGCNAPAMGKIMIAPNTPGYFCHNHYGDYAKIYEKMSAATLNPCVICGAASQYMWKQRWYCENHIPHEVPGGGPRTR